MKKRGLICLGLMLILIFFGIEILLKTTYLNHIFISRSFQIFLILMYIGLSIHCTFYIRKIYKKEKYSYKIITYLGLSIFLNINIIRHIYLAFKTWYIPSFGDVYVNALESFSYFIVLVLPFIIILAIYSIITNLILIKKEGFSPRRMLSVILGILVLISLIGSQTLYYLFSKFISDYYNKIVIDNILKICINATLTYFYTLIIATLYCNIKAGKHTPKYDKDFVIILGSKIREDGTLTPLLKGRVDKAIEFGNKEYEINKKKVYYVPSVGKGSDEVISEADAIKNYLLEQGIDEKQIIVENESTSTYENMKFSKKKIDEIKKNGKIIFSTTNYHVFRSGVIAADQHIDCEGIGSKTKWYFYTNALIREFVANIVRDKKNNIVLLLSINFTLICLLLIAKHYYFL